MKRFIINLFACVLVVCASIYAIKPSTAQTKGADSMSLGNFSVSLAVKDVDASRAFYEKLGFKAISSPSKRMAIMQNDTCTIGLFQGLFEKNILTFNPGWDRSTATLPDFQDVRDIQKTLVSRGLKLATTADETTTGPASVTLYDPDGNQITIDQHVARPKK